MIRGVDNPMFSLKIKKLLEYHPVTDLWNGVAYTATADLDMFANQNFTLRSANSVILVINNTGLAAAPSAQHWMGGYGYIDSTRYRLMANFAATGAVYGGSVFGGGPMIATGLAAGTHTTKLGIWQSGNGTLYERPSTNGQYEQTTVEVLELRARRRMGSRWRVSVPRVRLAFSQSNDRALSGFAINTWTDLLSASQSFTVMGPRSVVLIGIRAGCYMSNGLSSTTWAGGRISIDSGTYIYYGGGGFQLSTGSNIGIINPFGGGSFWIMSGLAAGSHTIMPQCIMNTAGTGTVYNCNCATAPTSYHFNIDVVEFPG